jgi:COP9 signalosome complex subunit 5
MHAKSGGDIEVMGLFQGRAKGDTFYIMDAFALPVEATETRVNAGNEANQYMIDYSDYMDEVNREEGVRGWYHSHPGYGCWLSGIDVDNQRMHQVRMFEPYLAIVVDPKRTMTAGKVEVGCFRTFTDAHAEQVKASQGGDKGKSGIRMDKIEEMGNHWHRYYQLEHSFYKTPNDKEMLERLWNEYWVATLSSSPLLSNALVISGQIDDAVQKLSKPAKAAEQKQQQ